MPLPSAILFTAFEPSGDDHASAVIRVLRERHPDLPIFAWGGPKMERAGATIVERTGDDAVMGMPGPKKIREHKAINGRIRQWLRSHPIGVHVPVDSPAANFPVCRLTREARAKIVHLVAPQLWAWGSWRAKKLRRLTDHVLCLLPFEETWFKSRGIPATFVGHPLFDGGEPGDAGVLAVPPGSPRILLLPGSRPSEMDKNFTLLLKTFVEISRARPEAVGVVALTNEAAERRVRGLAGGAWPQRLVAVHGRTDDAIAWCDLALVVSGTVTLQVARRRRPMVVVYKSNPVAYSLVGWWVIDTEFFTLPNLIAGREIVPEFVPHFGDERPLITAAEAILSDPARAQAQREALEGVCARFKGQNAAENAAAAIERAAGLRGMDSPA